MGEELEVRIERARNSKEEQNLIIADYIPFIRSCVMKHNHNVLEFDDMMTVAMLGFVQSIKSYEKDKGTFLAYSSRIINNRIIDEERKELRYSGKVVAFPSTKEENDQIENQSAVEYYNKEEERKAVADEIVSLSQVLLEYKITFNELPNLCPKQKKSRELCIDLANFIANNSELYSKFENNRRIPQAETAKGFGISVKTVEKYRKYLVVLLIIMSGQYPNIGSFIPKSREVKR